MRRSGDSSERNPPVTFSLGARLRRSAAIAVAAVALASGTLQGSAPARAAVPDHVVGADISWPQCPKGTGIPTRQGEDKPMPAADADFVVVGLTNGPGFTPNPCLADEVRWMKEHHVWAGAYAMTTYPSATRIRRHGDTGPHHHRRLVGKLWNTGYAEAAFNVAVMEGVGLESPFVWVDVEPYPVSPWTRNRTNNAAVVRGAVRGYQDAGYRVGFYSTQSLWEQVVGGLHYGYPEWRTAGQTSMSSALYKCSHYAIQGGPALMAQWWGPLRDFDVMCPGYARDAQLRTYFHRY